MAELSTAVTVYPYGQKIRNTSRHIVRSTGAEGRELGSCSPEASATHAGLAAVAVNAVVLIWELARAGFLTIRDGPSPTGNSKT